MSLMLHSGVSFLDYYWFTEITCFLSENGARGTDLMNDLPRLIRNEDKLPHYCESPSWNKYRDRMGIEPRFRTNDSIWKKDYV